MSTLSIDSAVTLLEPAAASPAPPARRGRTARPTLPAERQAPTPAARPVDVAGHGRRAVRSATPRARRASASSTLSPAVVAGTARLVAVRSLGIGLAATAVTVALASKSAGTDAATVAALSVRGLAVAAILCAAWGFQDRPRLGTLRTVRAWYGTATVIGLAHALLILATMPHGAAAHLAAAPGAFVLDAVLVAAPALLGARAGRPEVTSTLA